MMGNVRYDATLGNGRHIVTMGNVRYDATLGNGRHIEIAPHRGDSGWESSYYTGFKPWLKLPKHFLQTVR
jgi:hypothetical protein